MTLAIASLLVFLAVAVVLFALERFPPDVIALGLLLVLAVTGLVPREKAFAGFGSDTVMMILGLLLLTAALLRTGVVDIAGRALLRHTGDDPDRLLLVVMLAVAVLSTFISNTAATAFFLPVVVGAAARARVSASRVLMPLAFASILTSSVTLISTSTNIVVSGIMTGYGLAPIGMFEMAPVGLPIAVVGLAYMWLVGRRMVPDRGAGGDLARGFGLHSYVSEVVVMPGSPLAGRTLAQAGLGQELDLTVLSVVRGKGSRLSPRADLALEAGDVLLVEGARADILKVKDAKGLEIKADFKLSDPDLEGEETRLAEAIVPPRSRFIGRSLKGTRFRERFGLQVLALARHGETLHTKLSQLPLRMGDLLLVQGRASSIDALEDDGSFRLLGAIDEPRPNLRRAPVAVAVFVAALAAATLGLVPLPVAVLSGALLAFLTRCISPEEAYREVEWKAIVLVGSMLAVGTAMEHTGAARYLATQLLARTGGESPALLLAAFFALTVFLTQPMSNQAAAVVVLPVAIQTALQLELNPRTFAMMVAVAASCSYLTPLEPSCLMVYAPGRYRFFDFVKVGSLLTLLIFVVALFLVPLVWPLGSGSSRPRAPATTPGPLAGAETPS